MAVRRKTLDTRWLRKPRYRRFIVVGSFIFSVNVLLVISLVSSYKDPSEGVEDPSGRGRSHVEGGSEDDSVFIKQQKQQVDKEKKLLKDKQVPYIDSNTFYNSNKLSFSAISQNSSVLRLEELDFKPNCNIKTKEAISAIHRAKTQYCKQTIANLTCLSQLGLLYPTRLNSSCPAPGVVAGRSLGCYQDDKSLRVLTGYFSNLKQNNSPVSCLNLCLQSGFPYAGVEYSTECFCGVDQPDMNLRLPDSSCNMKCPADPSSSCGGYLTVNVYQTGIIKFLPQTANTAPADGETPVRIVYLLTLNGRALRQVKRLIKALYHVDHYLFIHIDARQDYLFRELLYLEKLVPNIRLMRARHATMWAGSSLLQMLKAAMNQIIRLDWNWDFVINLSESDFPIKKNDELVKFLTANRGKNYVKSTGREIQRFIQKQGLDKTFVECDAHMWRIGDRALPQGLQMDGGSDWVCLSKTFVEYILKEEEEDELLRGLNKIYKYTLLPAESFFHTLLRNSKFCNTYIDNNLHLTNWKRHLGCKCQNKHIVDWCGCSPNDFKPEDWSRIQGTTGNQLYFARKFEAIINQEIINKVEEWLFGQRENNVNVLSYWQSIYNHNDLTPKRDDFLLTISASLTRLALSDLTNSHNISFNVSHVVDISSYHYDDVFKGILVLYEVQYNNKTIELETWFKLKHLYQQLEKQSVVKDIKVSSDFDVKEQTSRNLIGSLSPFHEIFISYQVTSDKPVNLTFLTIDPAGQLAQVNDVTVTDKSQVNVVKPGISQPLLPGVWQVRCYHDGFLSAVASFIVIPFEFMASSPVTEEQIGLLHRGSVTYKINSDKIHWTKALDNNDNRHSIALANQKRVGRDLREWIDSLTKRLYFSVETCTFHHNVVSLEACSSTVWSTAAPDPKSQINSFNKNTGKLTR